MPGFIDELIKAYYVRRLYAFGIILTVGAIILLIAIASIGPAQRPQLAQAAQQNPQPIGQPRDERQLLRDATVKAQMGHHW